MSTYVKLLIGLIPRCGCARSWGSRRPPGRRQFLRAPRGASILTLTARQVGKTTTAAWAMAHTAIFHPGIPVRGCLSDPAAKRRSRAQGQEMVLLKCGVKIVIDNVYGLELENGSRVLALPGSDDSIRGYTVDGWIIADEAARLSPELISALRPMRARRPKTRLAMLSTAWSRTDPFWSAWERAGEWIRIKATVDEASDVVRGRVPRARKEPISAKRVTSANTSVFRRAVKSARSPGTCTRVQHPPRPSTFLSKAGHYCP